MSDPTAVLPNPGATPAPRRPWGLVAIIASVVAVLLVAGIGLAAWRFLAGGGPRPAEVLPASTFALATVDLDPSGGQKIDAITTLRKFPSFRQKSGVRPDTDVAKKLFEQVQHEGSCAKLSYDQDVKPWVGKRAGVAGVLLDDKPVPAVTLQVSDPDKARDGFAALVKCSGDSSHFGWTISGDYIVASDSTAHAKSIAAAGKKSPLSQDSDFQKWTDEAGGAGIVNLYVGPTLIDVFSQELDSGSGPFSFGDSGSADSQDKQQLSDALAQYKDFKGAAAVLRFKDSGIELSSAGSAGKAANGGGTVASHVAAMPKDTALLIALAMPKGAFDAFEKADPNGSSSRLMSSMLGIDFPADFQTLLGKSLSLSIGGDAPTDLSSISSPEDLSIGALINGDPTKIDAVIAKLEHSAGTTLDQLKITKTSRDGKVVLASNQKYADQLLGSGSLGDDAGFKDAVPHAQDARMIVYADLDGGWASAVKKEMRDSGDKDAAELAMNLDAVRSFGASAWDQDGISHGLVRLSVK